MGKIKSKLVRRTSGILLKEDIGFNEDFKNNKKILGRTMPSKKIRNQMAGLISKLKRQEKEKEFRIKKETEKASKNK